MAVSAIVFNGCYSPEPKSQRALSYRVVCNCIYEKNGAKVWFMGEPGDDFFQRDVLGK
jgi:hypothetical protein